MARTFRPDRAGIVAMLKSAEVGDLVQGIAAEVVASVPPYVAHSGETVKADARLGLTEDRRRAMVALVHPSSDAIEAKHGLLARAVSAAGLQLRSKK